MSLTTDWNHIRWLRGSPNRDAFKQAHKLRLGTGFYATDADLFLICRAPPGVVALLDYKQLDDAITFTEIVIYNHEMQKVPEVPVFIVRSDNPSEGPFSIFRYWGGNPRPHPPLVNVKLVCTCADWLDFRRWESQLRWDWIREQRLGYTKFDLCKSLA